MDTIEIEQLASDIALIDVLKEWLFLEVDKILSLATEETL